VLDNGTGESCQLQSHHARGLFKAAAVITPMVTAEKKKKKVKEIKG
jgi:hypothetical protein